MIEVFSKYVSYLKTEKLIRVYLPESYPKNAPYKTIYMHDGQNTYDDKNAAYGAGWHVHKALDDGGIDDIIVIGIDNSKDEKRLDEYSPFLLEEAKKRFNEFQYIPGGLGDQYLSFIANDLKAYIDKIYQTDPSATASGMIGSSMGGYISTYAACKYNSVFSRFGCLSNSYWVNSRDMIQAIKESDFNNVKRFYMDVGTNESDEHASYYIDSNTQVYQVLKDKLEESALQFKIIEGGIHFESAWASRILDIIKFMFEKE